MTQYVDLDTLQIVTQAFLSKKYARPKVKGQELSDTDLEKMNAARVVDNGGDIRTGNAVLVDNAYQVEYRSYKAGERRRVLKSTRDDDLSAMVYNFGDGRIMQVREGDHAVIKQAIEDGYAGDWVMQDNTVRVVTTVDLVAALTDGKAQFEAIFKTYMQGLKELQL
jgi:hypothetical protein